MTGPFRTRYGGLPWGYVYVRCVRGFTLHPEKTLGNGDLSPHVIAHRMGLQGPRNGPCNAVSPLNFRKIGKFGRESRPQCPNWCGIAVAREQKKWPVKTGHESIGAAMGKLQEGNTRERQWEEECAPEMSVICWFTG